MKPAHALAAVLLLAACHRSPEAKAVQQNADALQAELENQAAIMEAEADNAADGNAATAMENAADGLKAASDNVGDAADARMHNLR